MWNICIKEKMIGLILLTLPFFTNVEIIILLKKYIYFYSFKCVFRNNFFEFMNLYLVSNVLCSCKTWTINLILSFLLYLYSLHSCLNYNYGSVVLLRHTNVRCRYLLEVNVNKKNEFNNWKLSCWIVISM